MDFLTILEKSLENSDFEVGDIERRQCDPDGDEGVLTVNLEDGRRYSIHFSREEA